MVPARFPHPGSLSGSARLVPPRVGPGGLLVVSGECVLVIENEERRLQQWDFVHCPPWTEHTFVGAGDGPCAIVMVGNRVGGFEVVYAVNEVAAEARRVRARGDVEAGRGLRALRPGGAVRVPGRLAAVSDDSAFVSTPAT